MKTKLEESVYLYILTDGSSISDFKLMTNEESGVESDKALEATDGHWWWARSCLMPVVISKLKSVRREQLIAARDSIQSILDSEEEGKESTE